MAKVFIEESTLTAIGNAIREKTGKTDLIDPANMGTEIASIEAGSGGSDIPEEAFTITGNCIYKFANDGWSWFFEANKDKLTTKDIIDASYMFYNSSKISEIPFDINMVDYGAKAKYMFSNCTALTRVPYVKGPVSSIDYMFYDCARLREIPEDWADFIDLSEVQKNTYGFCNYIFTACFALRSIPQNLLNKIYSKGTTATYVPYTSMFSQCCTLEKAEVAVQPSVLTANRFSSTVSKCCRLGSFTFNTEADGSPKTASWKAQVLDLSEYTGYFDSATLTKFKDYSSITADKEVKDDATYQALKNDPDWFSTKLEYSRYNHDSAVETINSLPDTSAYLATAGGTNTIKFKKAAGSATDGGAIENLTAEELKIAADKGWTVALV
jgi:hypothetical protein